MKQMLTSTKKVRFAFFISIFLFLATKGIGQSDSLAVVNAKWQTKKIAPGIVLKHYWFDQGLFHSNQNINILEIKLNRRNKIDVAAESQQLKPASVFGEEYAALAALNGTFFDMKNGGSVDYIRLDDKVFNENKLGKNNSRALHQKAAIIINRHKVRIAPWDGTDNWEKTLAGEDIMVTGPLLINNRLRAALDSTSMYVARHPRTAMAIKGNKAFLITVDGRNERAAGMSLYELANFLKWLQVDDGVNLDGGGSTTLWIKGFPEGGVVNHPSDNKKMMQSTAYKPGMDLDNLAADDKKWDHSGERPVANVLLVNKKK